MYKQLGMEPETAKPSPSRRAALNRVYVWTAVLALFLTICTGGCTKQDPAVVKQKEVGLKKGRLEPASASPRALTACEILTATDVSEITGAIDVQAISSEYEELNSCEYQGNFPKGAGFPGNDIVFPLRGSLSLEPSPDETLKVACSSFAKQSLTGVGDEACESKLEKPPEPIAGTSIVLTEDQVLFRVGRHYGDLVIGGLNETRAQTVRAAKLAASRLPR